MSNDSSPVYIRRSLTLPPQNGPGPPNTNVKLSPNHVFLQQHLPPIFPHSGSSSEAAQHETPATHPMVILTPTTQQWKDLKEIRRLSGQDDDSEGSTEGSEAYEGRQSSSASEDGYPPPSSELMLRLDTGSSVASARSKPLIRKSTSADFLGKELIHTPDPGSPTIGDEENVSPIRPVFKPVIIAPSPVMPEDEQVPVAPETPTRSGPQAVSPTLAKQLEDEHPDHADDGTFGFGVRDLDLETPFDDSLGANDDPVRFASIGRRESLHVANKPEVRPDIPRTKTKRELERERLFKDLDEDIMSEGIESNDSWIGGVQQIGLGGGLGARPNPADAVMEGRNTVFFDNEFSKTTSLPIAAKPVQISLTHPRPFKPSPLHASPLTVTTGLPTPETPLAETSSTLGTPGRSRTPSRTSNLASLRDFARSLVSPRPQHMRGTSRPSTPSPPKSPRSPRQRDSTRFSLVAGRVVQPFAVPASTALPLDSLGSEKPSLQSFSPFRSPSPVTSKTAGGHVFPPSFNRFDSAISIAPSVGVPSECTTPSSETAGGVGGRGIEDYAILKEAGKGAYGLVMRAKVKGQRGEPVGVSAITSGFCLADESRKR